MKSKLLLLPFLLMSLVSFSQNGWKVCSTPSFVSRVDDIFMVNTKGWLCCYWRWQDIKVDRWRGELGNREPNSFFLLQVCRIHQRTKRFRWWIPDYYRRCKRF